MHTRSVTVFCRMMVVQLYFLWSYDMKARIDVAHSANKPSPPRFPPRSLIKLYPTTAKTQPHEFCPKCFSSVLSKQTAEERLTVLGAIIPSRTPCHKRPSTAAQKPKEKNSRMDSSTGGKTGRLRREAFRARNRPLAKRLSSVSTKTRQLLLERFKTGDTESQRKIFFLQRKSVSFFSQLVKIKLGGLQTQKKEKKRRNWKQQGGRDMQLSLLGRDREPGR